MTQWKRIKAICLNHWFSKHEPTLWPNIFYSLKVLSNLSRHVLPRKLQLPTQEHRDVLLSLVLLIRTASVTPAHILNSLALAHKSAERNKNIASPTLNYQVRRATDTKVASSLEARVTNRTIAAPSTFVARPIHPFAVMLCNTTYWASQRLFGHLSFQHAPFPTAFSLWQLSFFRQTVQFCKSIRIFCTERACQADGGHVLSCKFIAYTRKGTKKQNEPTGHRENCRPCRPNKKAGSSSSIQRLQRHTALILLKNYLHDFHMVQAAVNNSYLDMIACCKATSMVGKSLKHRYSRNHSPHAGLLQGYSFKGG